VEILSLGRTFSILKGNFVCGSVKLLPLCVRLFGWAGTENFASAADADIAEDKTAEERGSFFKALIDVEVVPIAADDNVLVEGSGSFNDEVVTVLIDFMGDVSTLHAGSADCIELVGTCSPKSTGRPLEA
jgi:hypothetical protein